MIDDQPNMPAPETNGFVRTLNNMGYMTSTLDRYSQLFIEAATTARYPVLDVGCAYGVASLAALEAGASVIANDIDARHLQILQARVSGDQKDRLQICSGAFPDLPFSPEILEAVLIARVLHFFNGSALERSAACVFDWLIPGGKVFVVAETPFLGNLRSFIPIYEARRKAGDLYPGFLDDVLSVAPDRGKFLPAEMHFLDPEVLERVFTAAGFVVQEAVMFARVDFPEDIQLDGRESVGLVASKPFPR